MQKRFVADFGLELCNGVFVNHVEKKGVAEQSGVKLGARLIYVNATPVYSAQQAEELIRSQLGLMNV